MKIRNTHQRRLTATPRAVDNLLASLGSESDALWPRHLWFPMRLDRPLAVDAKGGHGPVRYHCSHRAPGVVSFTFDSILGSTRWRGEHRFEVREDQDGSLLKHDLTLEVRLREYVQWLLVVGPLHNAILEDLLDRADDAPKSSWSLWVRLLRRVLPRVRAKAAVAAGDAA